FRPVLAQHESRLIHMETPALLPSPKPEQLVSATDCREEHQCGQEMLGPVEGHTLPIRNGDARRPEVDHTADLPRELVPILPRFGLAYARLQPPNIEPPIRTGFPTQDITPVG